MHIHSDLFAKFWMPYLGFSAISGLTLDTSLICILIQLFCKVEKQNKNDPSYKINFKTAALK